MLPIECLEFISTVRKCPSYKELWLGRGRSAQLIRELGTAYHHVVYDGGLKCGRCYFWFWGPEGDYD